MCRQDDVPCRCAALCSYSTCVWTLLLIWAAPAPVLTCCIVCSTCSGGGCSWRALHVGSTRMHPRCTVRTLSMFGDAGDACPCQAASALCSSSRAALFGRVDLAHRHRCLQLLTVAQRKTPCSTPVPAAAAAAVPDRPAYSSPQPPGHQHLLL